MTINQKLDALSDKLEQRFDKIDAKLLEHDKKFLEQDKLFEGIGNAYVELSYKIDIIIRQISDLPAIREDIAYLKAEAAFNRGSFKKIDEQLIKIESRGDYLLNRIEKVDERIDKISSREYA